MDTLDQLKSRETLSKIDTLYLDVRNGIIRELMLADSKGNLETHKIVDQDLSKKLLKPTAVILEEIDDEGPLEWGCSKLKELFDKGFKPTFTIPRSFERAVLENGLTPRDTLYQSGEKILAGTVGIEYFQDIQEDWRIAAILMKPTKYKLMPRFTGNPPVFRGVVKCNEPIAIQDLILIDTKDMRILYPRDIPNIDVLNNAERITRNGIREIVRQIL